MCLKIPGARGSALFELSVAAALTGRPQEAVTLLAKLDAEEELDAYRQRAYAQQLIQLGDLDGAVARLEAAEALEPWAFQEHASYRQFFDYWLRFPLAEAVARAEALKTAYAFRTAAQLADDVMNALGRGQPYSMIRLNDGEGSILHLSVTDQARYDALYLRNRREFHVKFWFGDESMVFDPGYARLCQEFNSILPNADCLGADQSKGLVNEYRWASHLERLIGHRPQLGVVSCHSGLPEALKRRFGLSEVYFHKTPGEAKVADPGAREPVEVWHERLRAELQDVRPGVLYLVGAGIPGKIYCDLIKKAGGIALDVGAVVDIWMKAPTRTHFQDMTSHALVP
jgi:hypothetical protein